MKKIRLTLSPIKHTSKLTSDQDFAFENSQINCSNTREITIQELSHAVLNGQSFCHCTFSDTKKKDNFLSTDLVVLDIDNKKVDNPLTLGDALNRLKNYGLNCNLAYTSFSDEIPKGETDVEKVRMGKRYRLIFMLPETITKIDHFEEILKDGFYHLFPEADKVSGVQFFLGGKNLGYINTDYLVDMEVLYSIAAMNQTSHYSSNKRSNEKMKQLGAIQNNRMKGDNDVQNNTIPFNKLKTSVTKRTIFDIRNFDWNWACSQFTLLDDFLNCKKKILHNELLYLYLAMKKIEGGATKWKESVINNPEIKNKKVSNIAYYLDQKVKLGYPIFEARISKYAPNDPAAAKYDFLTNISQKLNGKIEESASYFMPFADATSSLSYYFTEVKSELGNGKYVIKCATGLGKTEEIIKSNNLAECIIAFPTHRLKEEVSKRLDSKGIEHLVVPEIPLLPNDIKSKYEELSRLGAYNEASGLLRQVSTGEHFSEFNITEEEKLRVRTELNAYFTTLEECQNSTYPVLTTHKRLLTSEFPNHSTIIIDEDIIPSLFEIKSTSVKDLRMMSHRISVGEGQKDLNCLIELTSELNNSLNSLNRLFETKQIRSQFSNNFLEKIKQLTLTMEIPVEGSVLGLFKSDYFFVDAKDRKNDPDGEKVIYYVKRQALPENKKIIVLSATANQEIYQKLFPKIEWQEFSNVHHIGRQIQVYDKGLSRSWMNQKANKRDLSDIIKFTNNLPVITFKKQKSRFKNPTEFSLESSEGFDMLKGKDIAVVGTPHLPIAAYALMAASLGFEFTSEDLKMERMKCEYNNMRFDFMTFKHEKLRLLQFYKIESQLLQACGRARTIREDSTVYLFASFPLLGYEKVTLKELINISNVEQKNLQSYISVPSGSYAA